VAKYTTVYPELLLSFVYFDTTQCGYIFEKDIEDLFYSLGLNLSRAQARRVAEKFVTRDALYYRKLTDRLKDEPFDNLLDTIDEQSLYHLGCGNVIPGRVRQLMDVEEDSDSGEPNAKKIRTPETEDGLVLFNGQVFDIKKLLEKTTRADEAKESIETMLVDLRKQNAELNGNYTKASTKVKDLSAEVKSISRKLADSESHLNSSNVSSFFLLNF
jgi:hypothetical protein